MVAILERRPHTEIFHSNQSLQMIYAEAQIVFLPRRAKRLRYLLSLISESTSERGDELAEKRVDPG